MAPTTTSQPDIDSLISQLTLDEKAVLIAGKDLWCTVPIPRLNIPSLKVSDGPNGARGESFWDGVKAACFPAGVSLAATWDTDLASQIGVCLGEETKTKGAHVLLGPTVCPHRDPRGGRNFESYSEDPFLAGQFAVNYIKGLQSQGVGATIKHFAVNEQETRRLTIDAKVGERAFREIYLKPFEIAIKESEPWAVMTSYNKVNGTHADSNELLLDFILRHQWGFRGLVMSDWGGTNSDVDSLKAGLDLEMPGPALKRTPTKVKAAIESGNLAMEVLDDRIKNVLNLLVKAGKFTNPEISPEQAIDRPEHRKIIRQAGSDGIVLLKNDRNVLPLKRDNLKSIAILGLAKKYLGHGGGSAGVNSHHKITAYDAFTESLGSEVDLKYSEGARPLRNLPPLSTNLIDEDGNPGATLRIFRPSREKDQMEVRNSSSASFKSLEDPSIASASVTTIYNPTVSGAHYLSFNSMGTTTVKINGDTVFHNEGLSTDVMAFIMGVATEQQKQYDFTSGKQYKIEVTTFPPPDFGDFPALSAAMLGYNLGFVEQTVLDADLISPAVEAAKSSDIAIVFAGHTPVWETEGTDRATIALPKDGSQDSLISAVADVNPNTIVVVSTGSPISMPWLSKVAAVIQAWLPGQEAGYSIADVILGKSAPGGKLPVTFPRAIEDVPAFDNFPGDRESVTYGEGVFVGYRHYDLKPDGILFPFGFGLSYTSFELSDAKASAPSLHSEESLTISIKVKNVGSVQGSEVVQVYVGPEKQYTERPIKELAGFAKAKLQPGESTQLSVTFDRDSIAYWSETLHKWAVDTGSYIAYIGTSSRDIHTQLKFRVDEDSYTFDP